MSDKPDTQGLDVNLFTRASRTSIHGRTPESENGLVVTWVDLERLEDILTELYKVDDSSSERYSLAEGAAWGLGSAALIEAILALLDKAHTKLAIFTIIMVFAVSLAFALRFFRQKLTRNANVAIGVGVQRIFRQMTIIRTACGVPPRKRDGTPTIASVVNSPQRPGGA